MRLLTVVLLWVGLAVVATPPATAAVSVTIDASKTTVMWGTPVTFAGRAVNAEPGSTVRLQRERADGTWATVQSEEVGRTERYSFSVVPPKRMHSYRVFKPRQLGQASATSASIVLTVRWQPSFTDVSAEALTSPTGHQTLVLTGTVEDSYRSPVYSIQSRMPGEAWQTDPSPVVNAGRHFTLEVAGPYAAEYRVRLENTHYTTRAFSPAFVHTWLPVQMDLNSGLSLAGVPSGPHAATVEVEIPEGQEVSLIGFTGTTSDEWLATVRDPSGEPVGSLGDREVLRFVAGESGTYVIDVEVFDSIASLTLWASTPKIYTAVIDGDAIPVAADFPGQVVDVQFEVAAGTAFAVDSGGHGPAVTTIDGQPVPGLVSDLPWKGRVQVAEQTGTLRQRYLTDMNTSSIPVRVLTAPQFQGVVDGPDVVAAIDVPGRVAIVHFDVDVASGARIGWEVDGDVLAEAIHVADNHYMVVAYGRYFERTGSVAAQGRSPLELSGTIDGAPVSVETNGSFHQAVDLTFQGEAGQVVHELRTTSAGHWGSHGRLFGPDGSPVSGLGSFEGVWRLPATGTYVLRNGGTEGLIGTIGVATTDQVTIPADGTPTTVVLDQPNDMVYAHVPVASGTRFTVTLDEISDSLISRWDLGVFGYDEHDYYCCARPGTSMTYTVGDPGNLYLLVGAHSDATGSLRLTITPVT